MDSGLLAELVIGPRDFSRARWLGPGMTRAPLPSRADRGLVAGDFCKDLQGEGAMAKAAGYKLATYQSSDGPRAGVIIGDQVFDVAALTGKAAFASILGILADWRIADAALRKAAASLGKSPGKGRGKSRARQTTRTRPPGSVPPSGRRRAQRPSVAMSASMSPRWRVSRKCCRTCSRAAAPRRAHSSGSARSWRARKAAPSTEFTV